MLQGIAFIGGIHGVGKSTICKSICAETGSIYLSASDVLKWKELNDDNLDKKVDSIAYTQKRLINGLNSVVEHSKRYLLDGHYCLLNKEGIIEKVPEMTFFQINPFSLAIILDNTENIQARLKTRDGKVYDLGTLNEMQESELAYATELSKILDINLNVYTPNDVANIINTLKYERL